MSRKLKVVLGCVVACGFLTQASGQGPGVPGGINFGAVTPIVDKFDRDKNGRLDTAERKTARDAIAAALGGRTGFLGRGEATTPRTAGPAVAPSGVRTYPATVSLYEPTALRTIFIEFENRTDWEKELESFNNTDVEVPARITVDGKVYEDVGIHFRGLSSYMMVPTSVKRSLNLSFDFVNKDQQLLGYSTLNLLNSHEDPSFLRSILFYTIARDYLPAPKANYVKVVINGESWGIYVNSQQYNKEFINEWYKTTSGARWKAPGTPSGQANWSYHGDDAAAYKGPYELKSKDDPKDWAKLINVFKVLNETPPERLEAALAPIFDVDGALRFLALDNALINNDGFWIRASDYVIYKDTKDIFHVFHQDANEAFSIPQMGQGIQPATGVELEPLYIANSANRPLAQKLLAVPALRAKYLGYVRDIATRWLDWNRLGPIAQQHHDLISAEIRLDTRKLNTTAEFVKSLTEDISSAGGFGPSRIIGLKNFADRRRAYLLKAVGQ